MTAPLRICRICRVCVVAAAALSLAGCGEGAWNNPYAGAADGDILYSGFSERPKHFDPARSYSSNEYAVLGQVVEPVLHYHYLKRPYELQPLTAAVMPRVTHFDAGGRVTRDDGAVATTAYDIEIRPGIRYQPHPAFARKAGGGYRYRPVTEAQLDDVHELSDFAETGSRELRAADYAYQIKRLADPAVHSPIAGILARHLVGFADLRARLTEARKTLAPGAWLDLRAFDMEGVTVLGPHRYRVMVRAGYPQFIYWLAMPFFAPMPWEADAFHSQPGFEERNLTLDWYPVGTGAYMLTENNPNLRMVLERNPNFRADHYPLEGEDGDAARGLLKDAGARLPFIDKVIYSLEKENIPYWNKFLQGYYDRAGISSDSFDQAVQLGQGGEFELTEGMRARGIRLSVAYSTSIYYTGFNMLDPVVGGDSERARKLRLALSIAMDTGEFISIFQNGRGIPAQGPLPPGIFGHRDGEAGVNRRVYDWRGGRAVRKPLAEARRLLAEAGYKDGMDRETGKPLVLYFDATGIGPDAKSWLNWVRKQFAKLDLQLVMRNTDWNRFQDKMREGNAQIFRLGWNADYPDPENFFFLLYGPNSKVAHQGENAANYRNPRFDRLFEEMRSLPNTPRRLELIDEMNEVLRRDAPWIWGFHPKSFVLHHEWLANAKPNLMAHNGLKYLKLDSARRARLRDEWNRPRTGPVAVLAGALALFLMPAVAIYRRRRRETVL
ncbi:MAG: ABC transporter substrate-binding protein [Gammaproteobacteria bacterium]|nr:ABC transporter substrate-binding protein [Gammaproteobacteria bacterium]